MDFVLLTREITFLSEFTQSVSLSITDDAVRESSEEFIVQLSLSGDDRRVSLNQNSTTVVILDNDRKWNLFIFLASVCW